MSTAAPCGRLFAEHDEGGGGQLWAAEVRPGCNRVAGGCVRAADPGAVAAVPADAGDGESGSGSASRSDSLIEFVKTNVAILPLLILTATTTLMPRSTRRPSPRTGGGPTSTRSRAATRQVRGPLGHRPATRQEIVPAGCPGAGKRPGVLLVREGGFEPGPTHAHRALFGQFEREMSSR